MPVSPEKITTEKLIEQEVTPGNGQQASEYVRVVLVKAGDEVEAALRDLGATVTDLNGISAVDEDFNNEGGTIFCVVPEGYQPKSLDHRDAPAAWSRYVKIAEA